MKSLAFFFTYILSIAPFFLVHAVSQLTVDCNSKIRPATHCALGSHYGLTENVPSDYKSLVSPLRLNVMRAPARMKKSGLTNFYGNEIWNEPDVTWKDATNGLSFNQMWKQTYDFLRKIDPNEKIIGPSFSWYEENKMKNFLQFSKQNNCLPDIIAWHELSGIDGVSSHFRSYRNLEKSLGISERPITINEYCDENHDLEGQPGSSARFIGRFERYKVDSAMITWWFVPHPGRLGSLLASDTQKGAGWYFYKWYSDMTGDMVNVTPPNENSKLIDGAACVDSNAQYVSFIFGGPNDGSVKANFKNLPSFLGSSVNVKVEKVDWKNKDTPSNGPNTIFEKKYTVNNGQLSIDINGCNATSGYRIYIRVKDDSTANGANVHQWNDNGFTSQQWIISNEGNGYKIMNVNANKVLDVSGNSKDDGGNVIIYTDNGNPNQRWIIKDVGGGYVNIENVNSGKNLDVDNRSMADGSNILQWSNNGTDNQQWKIISLTTASNPLAYKPPVSNPPATSNASASCSPKILTQGYKCCSTNNCDIYITDESGRWGLKTMNGVVLITVVKLLIIILLMYLNHTKK
ncbi:hypothetical protein LY90DRAFT_638514 [Neocallimastix californiae]|uniref:CBM10 domain-containing protein n=1 Tax=Neocallimastix californiae TaxID=1754190 RepID=A0A1Y1ZFK5_9FUNG|nr:hypothetical protein LY90DRAFT_638514 [Neocallimastix californiae]|eukprot:ORY08979.1 hypothetical protein LY90DRAFT_638514 [Neocallimastix californiae]